MEIVKHGGVHGGVHSRVRAAPIHNSSDAENLPSPIQVHLIELLGNRLALPEPRLLQTGTVQPSRRLGCLKRAAPNPAEAPAIADESRLAPPTRRQDQTRRVWG